MVKGTELKNRMRLLGRLSAVTDEFEDIVKVSTQLDKKDGAKAVDVKPLSKALKSKRPTFPELQVAYQDIVLGGLCAGRYRSESYIMGKMMAMDLIISSASEAKKACENIGLEILTFKKPVGGFAEVKAKRGLAAQLITGKAQQGVCFF